VYAGVSGDAFCVCLDLNVLRTWSEGDAVVVSLCDAMTAWEGEETDEIG
jgi:hypothetical protein